jgi:import inner membrane translocase subunit TIM16
MAANDVKKGGSFYIQSKVYRAKELLDKFQKEKELEEQQASSANNVDKNL